MPLRCIDPTGRSIHSFDLSHEEWQALGLENREARHLRMPCCLSSVVLKRSLRGTRFFAHKAVGLCTTAPEREEHLHLKKMAVDAARANDWAAETEVSGSTPSGEPWRADVLAENGKHKVAVEIQWSGQTDEETLRRQERYKEAGVRGLWLLRQPGFPTTRGLPAVCVGGSLEEGFEALIPFHEGMSARDRKSREGWHQRLPMEEFLQAAFSKRLRYGIPLNIEATVSVHTGLLECWHQSCRAQARIVTLIEVIAGPNECQFTVSELGKHPDLLRSVLDQLPRNLNIGLIKPRFSKTVGEWYMSNGCFHCDRLIGAHFEHDALGSQEEICTFPIRVSEQWLDAIHGWDGYCEAWSAYSTAP